MDNTSKASPPSKAEKNPPKNSSAAIMLTRQSLPNEEILNTWMNPRIEDIKKVRRTISRQMAKYRRAFLEFHQKAKKPETMSDYLTIVRNEAVLKSMSERELERALSVSIKAILGKHNPFSAEPYGLKYWKNDLLMSAAMHCAENLEYTGDIAVYWPLK
jgi:hypothetical protein